LSVVIIRGLIDSFESCSRAARIHASTFRTIPEDIFDIPSAQKNIADVKGASLARSALFLLFPRHRETATSTNGEAIDCANRGDSAR
jgi:hypothetical protein